jgi:hypothetical protein
VAYQLDILRQCLTTKHALDALEDMLQTLDATYARIFKNISQRYQREAKSILMLLVLAVRPMTMQEMADAMVVNVEKKSFPIENRFSDPCDIVKIFPSLIIAQFRCTRQVATREGYKVLV